MAVVTDRGGRAGQPGLHDLRARDRGMVVAETAVGMLALGVVLALVIASIALGVAHVRTLDAARSAARLAARGESVDVVTKSAHRSMPGSQVAIQSDGDVVTIDVSAGFRVLPLLPEVTVAKRASVETEFR